METRDIRPAFVVEKQMGPFEKKVIRLVKKKVGDKTITEKVEAKKVFSHGYMVVFPKGHSIFIETEAELQRLGFAEAPDLIDMESGDIVSKLGIPGMTMPQKAKVQVAKAA